MKIRLTNICCGMIALLIILSTQTAFASTYINCAYANLNPPFSLDYVRKTANGYEVSVTHTSYSMGAGGTFDTFELIYNNRVLDSKTGSNGYNDSDDAVWVIVEDHPTRGKVTYNMDEDSAVFHLPPDTPSGVYTVKLTAKIPDIWGGPYMDVYEVTFKIDPPAPAETPSPNPTAAPTATPTVAPTGAPTVAPTAGPTAVPTVAPTAKPTAVPVVITPSPAPGTHKTEMRYNQSVCSLGLPFKEMKPGLTDKWYTFTPVDLSVSGKQEIKLIAANITVIGTLTVEVKDGEVTVNRKLIYPAEELDMAFTLLPDLESVSTVDMKQLPEYQFGQKISIENDLQSDTHDLLYVLGHVNYDFNDARYDKFSKNSSQYQKMMEQLKQLMLAE